MVDVEKSNLMVKVQGLRKITGASISECRKAVEESNGDEKTAIEILRKKGLKIASKKQERATKTGIITAYLHPNKMLAAMVEVRCETDFVAKSEEFQKFAHDIAMQIAAMKPSYVKAEDVPQEIVENLKSIYRKEFENMKKPVDITEKIVEGKIFKRFEETCLLNQLFVKNNDFTIEDILKETIAKFGENIEIGKFCLIEI